MKLISFILCLVSVSAFAQMKVGDTIQAFKVKDQFEQSLELTDKTKFILLSNTKENGDVVNEFLKAKTSDFLNEKNILYIADVTKVPGIVMSMFMMPAFKKYSYKVGLLEDKKLLESLPKEPKKMTLIELDKLVIKKIDYLYELKDIKF